MVLPRVMGHQFVGEVLAVGPKVNGLVKGDLVLPVFVVGCGQCGFCQTGRDSICATKEMIGVTRDGGFANIVLVPASSLIKLPAGVDPVPASLIGCSYATAERALRQGRVAAGQTVVCLGNNVWTLTAAELARARGAHAIVVTEHPGIEQRARDIGWSHVQRGLSDPRATPALFAGAPNIDVAIDFECSTASQALMLQMAAPGGRAVFVGTADTFGKLELAFPMAQFLELEIDACCLVRKDEVRDLVSMHAAGQLQPQHYVNPVKGLSTDALTAAMNRALDEPQQVTVFDLRN
jgi:D-arabinose 1-dehydrogenase-like Zn-dependent alcohol dehydrogenase